MQPDNETMVAVVSKPTKFETPPRLGDFEGNG
jgi:hypothetical protein